jgi:hypothetical protein
VGGLISESIGFPASDRIGFNEAASLFSYGFESGFQGRACFAALAVILKNGKAGDSPKFLCAFGDKPSIFAAVLSLDTSLVVYARPCDATSGVSGKG